MAPRPIRQSGSSPSPLLEVKTPIAIAIWGINSQGFPETPLDATMQRCAISQQLVSLQSTGIYTGNMYKNITFNFKNLFVALRGLHWAQIGQGNGMMFCKSGICVWTTGPVQMEFPPGQWNFHTGTLLLTLQFFFAKLQNLPAECWVRKALAWNPLPS